MPVSDHILQELNEAVLCGQLTPMGDFAKNHPDGPAMLVATDICGCPGVLENLRRGLHVQYSGSQHPAHPARWNPFSPPGIIREVERAVRAGSLLVEPNSFASRHADEVPSLVATDPFRSQIVNAIRKRSYIRYDGSEHPRNPASQWFREYGPKPSRPAFARLTFAINFSDPGIVRNIVQAAPDATSKVQDGQWFENNPGRSIRVRLATAAERASCLRALLSGVAQIMPGARTTMLLNNEPVPPQVDDVDELTAIALFSRACGYDEIVRKYFHWKRHPMTRLRDPPVLGAGRGRCPARPGAGRRRRSVDRAQRGRTSVRRRKTPEKPTDGGKTQRTVENYLRDLRQIRQAVSDVLRNTAGSADLARVGQAELDAV